MDKLKFLIVEDDIILSEILINNIKTFGCEVINVVTSGHKAIKCIESEDIDMILMDINLEGNIDGIDTANYILKNYNIPIVFITACSDEKVLERIVLNGFYWFLLKPFTVDSLRSTVFLSYTKFQTNISLSQMPDKNILQGKKVLVWKGDQLYVLCIDDIIYLDIYKGIVQIHIKDAIFTVRGTLTEWESKLSNKTFFRSHKSYLVNIEKVKKLIPCIDASYLMELNETNDKIPLSRFKVSDFHSLLK